MNKTVHEKSCGLLVFNRQEGKLKYLLLHYPEGHWDLPKGHVEKSEDEKATAKRELEEETGIKDIEFKENFRVKIHYYFKRKNETVSKDVVFFLAETKNNTVKISHEHQNFIWLPYGDAIKKLTFDNVKNILKKAHMFLSGQSLND